ncbi:MAG: ABC transporter permease [Candidatus Omnitrophica bacterium]|nr:ABC transporter permease [Candidatus Omnitrophota bacterium]
MSGELFIAWRNLSTKRKERFISLISVISVLGVAIGVMALIVVLGVMSGFDRQLREKIVGNYSHITVFGYEGIPAGEADELVGKLITHPHVRGASPYVQGQVLLKEASRFFAVSLRGIDRAREPSVTRLDTYLLKGSLEDLGSGSVVVGKELAAFLGVGVGSKLSTYSALGKQRDLTIAGIFSSGMYDYDMNLVFTDIATAQEIMGMKGVLSAVAVKLDNLYLAEALKEELSVLAGFNYGVRTWMELNQNFFSALKLEKLAMFIILTLIILVAAFNIVSTLIVMVVGKTKDIGILRAIGMTAARVRRIFIYQGLIIGGLGTLCGAGGGLLLCALLRKYHFIKLPQDIYSIDRLPVYIELWPDITLIVVAALVITLASTIYPALKAAGLKPAEALRYE